MAGSLSPTVPGRIVSATYIYLKMREIYIFLVDDSEACKYEAMGENAVNPKGKRRWLC